jgi:hypothetical protein
MVHHSNMQIGTKAESQAADRGPGENYTASRLMVYESGEEFLSALGQG